MNSYKIAKYLFILVIFLLFFKITRKYADEDNGEKYIDYEYILNTNHN